MSALTDYFAYEQLRSRDLPRPTPPGPPAGTPPGFAVVESSNAAPTARQRGMMLLEALIAIAVFSIGVLGNVALHAQAIRHVHAAQCRSEATHLVQALIGRMWAEDPAALAARYDATVGGDGYVEFARATRRLPGASTPGNAPDVRVEPGPAPSSRKVTVAVHWQLPGEPVAHRHGATAVIGQN
jgi:type IV pilus assembly protein PilV